MEKLIEEYMQIDREITQLKSRKKEIEINLIKHLDGLNKEQFIINEIALNVIYRSKYEFNKLKIYEILNPKNLFIDVVRVNQPLYDHTVRTSKALSENEVESLVGAVEIKNTQRNLKMRKV